MLRTIILCLAFSQLLAQNSVFISGTEGHKSYRIPAIISLPNGNLLAFAEGRVQGSGDFGDINIVMKRSSDNGKTWSSMSTIVDYDSLQAGILPQFLIIQTPLFRKGVCFCFTILAITMRMRFERARVCVKFGIKLRAMEE